MRVQTSDGKVYEVSDRSGHRHEIERIQVALHGLRVAESLVEKQWEEAILRAVRLGGAKRVHEAPGVAEF